MFKKIFINIIVLILIAIGFHFIRIYSILDNAYQTSELFKTVSNITVKRDIYKDNGRFPLDTEIILLFDDTVPVFSCLKDILSRVSNEYTIHCYLRHMQSFYLCEYHFNDVLFKYI